MIDIKKIKSIKPTFKNLYLVYVLILLIAIAAVLVYVSGLLKEYEKLLPEKRVEEAIQQLAAEAEKENFWTKYSLPEINTARFEEHLDVKETYLEMFQDEDITYKKKNMTHAEDELYYLVEKDGFTIAEVKLKAKGPVKSKLVVFSTREWEIESVQPVLAKGEYSLTVPVDFQVTVNGLELTAQDGESGKENEVTYKIKEVYLLPEFHILDKTGAEVSYVVSNNKVKAEYYNYTLTLPAALTVKLNGEECTGTDAGEKLVRYDICVLKKPEIEISDAFGNTYNYKGGSEIPLTYATITTEVGCDVTVADQPIPEQCITTLDNPEYEQLQAHVQNLPQICVYDIAILIKDADITVVDKNGKEFALEEGSTKLDLTTRVDADSKVPEEVEDEVDVLNVAQSWSLFMSCDMPLAQLTKHLLTNSYQYQVALKYSTSVDITFTSAHILADPAFTDISVTNFKWITDDCFSVDIAFVKHMILTRNGNRVDDAMNDRFFFVKQDETNDNVDNPTWKLVSMKEIVNNEK